VSDEYVLHFVQSSIPCGLCGVCIIFALLIYTVIHTLPSIPFLKGQPPT
jgi:hypothetical protein